MSADVVAYPRCFDVISCDAIYLRPSMIDMVLASGKHLVATLKGNQSELFGEARTLLPEVAGKLSRRAELRQAAGFTTDCIHTLLRVVHSHETDWLVMCIACAVFHCFLCNLQAALR